MRRGDGAGEGRCRVFATDARSRPDVAGRVCASGRCLGRGPAGRCRAGRVPHPPRSRVLLRPLDVMPANLVRELARKMYSIGRGIGSPGGADLVLSRSCGGLHSQVG
jgi:hypothetical protein